MSLINQTAKVMAEHLKANSKWRHTDGSLYSILMLTNMESERHNYIPTVVYKGTNGIVWSRPVYDWYRSMEKL